MNEKQEEKGNEKDGKVTILINQRPYHLAPGTYTGAQIKALAEAPPEYLLVFIVKDPDEVAGGDDKVIRPDEGVVIKSGMRFRVVNPATFGLGSRS